MPRNYDIRLNDNTQDGDTYNKFVFYSVGTIRTYTGSFISMFKNIKVRRYEADFVTIAQTIDVPIKFGSQSKEHYERTENYTQEGGRQAYLTLPAIAIKFGTLNMASDRAKSTNTPRYFLNDTKNQQLNQLANSVITDLEPTPYDYTYTMVIKTNRTEDMVQILEQILPYQKPSRFIRVKEIPFMNIERDISVKLTSVSTTWSDEMTSDANRIHEATLEFTLEGYVYSPITSAHTMKAIYLYIYTIAPTELDRRTKFLLAVDEASIPTNATNVTPYENGTFLYQLTDSIDSKD